MEHPATLKHDQEDTDGRRRCGVIAVVGAPNSGKSTLVNRLIGAKVAIVSPKVQTTRFLTRGIVVKELCQLIVVDTPGFFEPRRRMERAMVASAWRSVKDADITIFVIDITRGYEKSIDEYIIQIKKISSTVIIALNKCDIQQKSDLGDEISIKVCSKINLLYVVSALTGKNIDKLICGLVEHAPPGPWLYPKDQISDQPVRLFAAEITREQIFHVLRQELPYKSTVTTDEWREQADGSVRVEQTIYVAKPSQRGVVIGKDGETIRRIGMQARKELQKILNIRIHLFLFVKVRIDWDERPHWYREVGLDYHG
jgi:GTP-binding protein Era